MEMRKIIHVDMDAFFASVEQLDNPSLRGLPVAVGHDAPRSVVSTASYEARRYGVHSAQPMATAKRLCPGLVVVEPRFERYKEISARVHEIFCHYTDLVEPISIDEAFLDVTTCKTGAALAMDVAAEIRARIKSQLHLTASAGVSYNKLLAKIASDYRKPDGLTVVHPARALDFLQRLPVENLWGVGPKTAQRLHGMHIFTVGQLRELSLRFLTDAFGKMGAVYYDYARGIDTRPVTVHHVRKSIGCECTFLTDIDKRSAAVIELYPHCTSRLRGPNAHAQGEVCRFHASHTQRDAVAGVARQGRHSSACQAVACQGRLRAPAIPPAGAVGVTHRCRGRRCACSPVARGRASLSALLMLAWSLDLSFCKN